VATPTGIRSLPHRWRPEGFRDVTLWSRAHAPSSPWRTRQARYRAARIAGTPLIRTRRPADHRGRSHRWRDAVAALTALQAEYGAWLEAVPANLQEGATAQALQAICDLDLGELQAIEPPRGFGRD
jgi:hypothetical protein